MVGLVVRHSLSYSVWNCALVGNTHPHSDIRRANVGDNLVLQQLNISSLPTSVLVLKTRLPDPAGICADHCLSSLTAKGCGKVLVIAQRSQRTEAHWRMGIDLGDYP